MNPALKDLGDHVASVLADAVVRIEPERDELAIVVAADALLRALAFLRDDANCQFKCLMDVCGVDWPERVVVRRKSITDWPASLAAPPKPCGTPSKTSTKSIRKRPCSPTPHSR